MEINQILNELKNWAPLPYQESYDNSGLIIGKLDAEVSKILVSLDITEKVMDEAIKNKFDLIISHHPIIFRGMKSFTGKTPEERVVMRAIENHIAIIAMHTNLDNVFHGVNYKLSQILGLENLSILESKAGTLQKLAVFIPKTHLEKVRKAIFDAGAGHIGNYDHCSFGAEGIGTFRAGSEASPFVGQIGENHQEEEIKMETIFPAHKQSQIIKALLSSHPYEEPAFDIFPLENTSAKIGAGMIGELREEMEENEFLSFLKQKLNAKCIRHTHLRGKKIKKIALCGGSGSFLIRAAKTAQADIFITGDVKYHDFFEANESMIIADVGHYESEQFTKELIRDFIIEKFPKFAVQISEHQTNPINYL